MDLQEIIKANYDSVVKRGLINNQTTEREFIEKIKEEFDELYEAFMLGRYYDKWEELSDVVLVCLNYFYHFGIDVESKLKIKIEKNNKRV